MGNIPTKHPLSLGNCVHRNVEVPDIASRVQTIRSLNDARIEEHLLREMESDLEAAERFAKKGNRELMEFCIQQSKDNMEKANAGAAVKEKVGLKIDAILSSITPDSEYNYHLSEVEYRLKSAEQYARDGNCDLMEFCIQSANEHAEKAESISKNLNDPSG